MSAVLAGLRLGAVPFLPTWGRAAAAAGSVSCPAPRSWHHSPGVGFRVLSTGEGDGPGSGGAKAICLHSGPAALPSGGIRGKKLLLACCCSFHSGDFSPFISLIHVPFRCAGASPAELGLPTWYPRAPKGPAGGSLLKGGVGFNP